MTIPTLLQAIRARLAHDRGAFDIRNAADLARLLEIVELYQAALESIEMRVRHDDSEGPELRAQNAADYRDACQAILAADKVVSRE